MRRCRFIGIGGWTDVKLKLSTNYENELFTDTFESWLLTKQDIYTKHNNPLEYWSTKRFAYPCVAKMAIDILLVPAMSAECERTFLCGGYGFP